MREDGRDLALVEVGEVGEVGSRVRDLRAGSGDEEAKDIGRRFSDRVMIGADFPVLEYEKIVADWRSLGYPEDVLEKILYRNAEAYFKA